MGFTEKSAYRRVRPQFPNAEFVELTEKSMADRRRGASSCCSYAILGVPECHWDGVCKWEIKMGET